MPPRYIRYIPSDCIFAYLSFLVRDVLRRLCGETSTGLPENLNLALTWPYYKPTAAVGRNLCLSAAHESLAG
jgi:hypothetical protein